MKIQMRIVLSAIFLVGIVRADVRFEAVPDKSSVQVDGTSSLHDWTVKSSTINGHLDLKADVPADATPQKLREAIIANPKAEIAVEIPVDKITSDKKDMDKKMYAALKQQQSPTITYTLTKLEIPKDAKADQEEMKVQTTGNLTVAGATKEVQIPMTLKLADAKNLKLSGNIELKMTDFGIKPPEAMLGMVKADDAVKVQFEWNTARAADATKK
jgi:hypothetical protein